jgi:hypothetical protein
MDSSWTRTAALALGLLAITTLARAEPAKPTATAVTAALSPEAAVVSSLTAEQRELLAQSRFVYIASTRKDGNLSQPAEIWFMWADGSVWVASSPNSWRAKRIRWGRPMAKIWIQKPDGPSFRARGETVADPARYDELCDAFSVKYSERWPRWEKSFRDGLRSGERVLIRYTPVGE